MRPLRLELEGFTSFKEPTEIDFSDADYFVLVGPTGSGKSTVVDAICFSLYGSVPRYENRNLVAPVISQGRLEAKVRFDFALNGSNFTVVRVVKRSGTGATTKEARLERDGEVVAGSADEVSAAIDQVLGLSFEHFTRCVVLPQGEFARFLHDKPADRQEMLVRLLSLDVYNRMMQAANARAKVAQGRLDVIEERLEVDFADATKDALKEAKAHLRQLEGLRKKVSGAAPALRSLEEAIAGTLKEIDDHRKWIERLADLRPPADLAAFADRLAHAQKTAEETAELVASAEKATAAALGKKKALPERPPLADAATAHRRRARLLKQIDEEGKILDGLRRDEEEAAKALADAEKAVETALEREAHVRDEHAAHHLAEGLEKGRPCPVCLQTVKTLPKHAEPADLEQSRVDIEAAREAQRRAADGEKQARRRTTEVKAGIDKLSAEAEMLGAEVMGYPDPDEVDRLLKEVDAALHTLEQAQKEERSIRRRAAESQTELKALQEEERAARRIFDERRDLLGPLSPPPPARRALAEDWGVLLSWAKEHIHELEEKAKAATARVEGSAAKRSDLVESLLDACRGCDVEADEDNITDAVIEAAGEAKNEVRGIEKALRESEKLRAEKKDLVRRRELAATLGNHLKASGFERWLVNEALQVLVAGAGEIMRDLSEDRYSLSVDDKGNFLVTDHYNADEKRSARTLSGGETFLASLALALSLSDRLLELAAEGSARLDAIFLDEGFGTLDADALTTVAATVENLAAKGRMVGIITHVRELADGIPLQYRVHKDSRTSSIEKVAS